MSNKKNLLNEATIRRFMSLANMNPLSENFLDNIEESDEETVEEGAETDEETVEEGSEPEETVEEEIDLTLEEEEEDLAMPMDTEEAGLEGEELPMEEPMDDMGAPEEEGTEVTLDGSQVAQIRAALEDALALVGELGGEEEAPMEEPIDDLAPEADAEEVPMDGGDEDPLAELLDDDAVVQEVFKRVVSRIAKKD